MLTSRTTENPSRPAPSIASLASRSDEELCTLLRPDPAIDLIAHDPDCRRVSGSARAHRFFGVAPDDNLSLSALPGEAPTHLTFLRDGCPLVAAELPLQRAARGESIAGSELEVRFGDGASRHIRIDAAPLRAPDGRPRGAVGAFTDITDRIHAEQALRDSESRFREAFENAPVGMVIAAPDGRLRNVNAAFCAITGYSSGELLADGFEFWRLTHPDDLAADREMLRRLLAGEVPASSLEKRFVRKDGRTVWVRASVSLRRIDGDQPQLIGLVENVAMRKAAEQAARASGERLRLAVDAARLGVFEWDAGSGRPLWENEHMYRIFGRARQDGPIRCEELFETFIHPEDVDAFRTAVQAALADGRPFQSECRIRRPDGELRWLGIRGDAERGGDGRIQRVFGMVADITPHKLGDEMVQRERTLRTLAEHSPDLIARYDRDLRHRFVNPAFARYFGRPAQDILGRTARELGMPKAPADLLDAAVARVFDNGAEQRLELILPTAAGDRYLEKRLVPERGADGTIETVLGVTRDMTERHQAEAERERLHFALERSHTRLQAAMRQLRTRNEELDQFASVVSHDLRAPLRAVHNLAGWLGEEEGARLSEAGRRQLDLLRQRVRHMDELVNGLLEFARASTRPGRVERVCVAELTRELVEARNPPPQFRIALAADLPCLETDRLRLQQVLGNLVENALKYHDRADGCLSVCAHDAGDHYEFAVGDDGPGIPPEHHERIFGMLQRGPDRTKAGGTGIGLAVVKRAVEGLGGRITLESSPGHGTTFRFTWPKQLSA